MNLIPYRSDCTWTAPYTYLYFDPRYVRNFVEIHRVSPSYRDFGPGMFLNFRPSLNFGFLSHSEGVFIAGWPDKDTARLIYTPILETKHKVLGSFNFRPCFRKIPIDSQSTIRWFFSLISSSQLYIFTPFHQHSCYLKYNLNLPSMLS